MVKDANVCQCDSSESQLCGNGYKDQHNSSKCTSSLWQQLQKVNTMATTQVVAVATTAQGQYQGNSCCLTQWQQLQKVNAVEKEGEKNC